MVIGVFYVLLVHRQLTDLLPSGQGYPFIYSKIMGCNWITNQPNRERVDEGGQHSYLIKLRGVF